MSNRLIVPAALAVIGGFVLANARSSASTAEAPAPQAQTSETAPATAFQTSAGDLPVLNRWFALGSGCRAKDDLPGDVTMEMLPQDPMRPNAYRARFHLDRLHLAPSLLADTSTLKFARECSIRLNINPPAGKKVTKVTATTGVAVDKPEGPKLTVLSELKIGNATLGRQESTFATSESVQSKESAITLVPGAKLDEQFPVLACAEPKIIGFNYTWIAERTAPSESVDVQLSGAKTLDIEAELSSCD